MLEAIYEHMCWIIFYVFVLIGVLIIYKIYKFRKVIEIDKLYKEYNNDGQIIQETRTRNIWDYNFFPGMSKLWHFSGWQILVAILTLIVILLTYLFTKDEKLFNLLGINFGLVLGMMLRQAKQ